ncbi:hypothetical protein ABT354_11130 [Streptomyces sp. NPDC000594]|uniref:hypothetical protein n=1 Tax=Streptomyces sp. NPDC000594 TaxID=3154261 RepID=UPI003323A549
MTNTDDVPRLWQDLADALNALETANRHLSVGDFGDPTARRYKYRPAVYARNVADHTKAIWDPRAKKWVVAGR